MSGARAPRKLIVHWQVPRVLQLGVARAQALLFRVFGHCVLELRPIRGLLERDHGLGREDVEACREATASQRGLESCGQAG